MVGRDGRPRQKNLLNILHEWIAFRFATVERRSRHRLGEVLRRIHILEGRMTVFLRIDEVIRCIREADEPKPDLMARFGLTEIQAEDILEIRLRQLARLEGHTHREGTRRPAHRTWTAHEAARFAQRDDQADT
jgi:topoisomerase-4 subunit A